MGKRKKLETVSTLWSMMPKDSGLPLVLSKGKVSGGSAHHMLMARYLQHVEKGKTPTEAVDALCREGVAPYSTIQAVRQCGGTLGVHPDATGGEDLVFGYYRRDIDTIQLLEQLGEVWAQRTQIKIHRELSEACAILANRLRGASIPKKLVCWSNTERLQYIDKHWKGRARQEKRTPAKKRRKK